MIVREEDATGDMVISFGGEIKSFSDGKFAGFLVKYSSADDTDLVGEYFTKGTEFFVEDGAIIPVLYDHGLNPTLKTRKIGRAKVTYQDAGLWIEGELNLRDDYEKAINDKLLKAGKAGLSSGAAVHMTQRKSVKSSKEITHWGIAEASLTPAPTEHRCEAMAIKSYSENHADPMEDLFAGDEFKGYNPNEERNEKGEWTSNGLTAEQHREEAYRHQKIYEDARHSGYAARGSKARANEHANAADRLDELDKSGKWTSGQTNVLGMKDGKDDADRLGHPSADKHPYAITDIHTRGQRQVFATSPSLEDAKLLGKTLGPEASIVHRKTGKEMSAHESSSTKKSLTNEDASKALKTSEATNQQISSIDKHISAHLENMPKKEDYSTDKDHRDAVDSHVSTLHRMVGIKERLQGETKSYSPEENRDANGKWTSGGSTSTDHHVVGGKVYLRGNEQETGSIFHVGAVPDKMAPGMPKESIGNKSWRMYGVKWDSGGKSYTYEKDLVRHPSMDMEDEGKSLKDVGARPFKGAFTSELADNQPEFYRYNEALREVMKDIANAAKPDIVEVTGVPVNVEGKVTEAVTEYAALLIPLLTDQINEWLAKPPSDNSSMYASSGNNDFYIKSGFFNDYVVEQALESSPTLDEHSAHVVSAIGEYTAIGASLNTGIKAWLKRCKDKIEFRQATKSGRAISTANASRIKNIHEKVGSAISTLQDCHNNIGELHAMAEAYNTPDNGSEKKSADSHVLLQMQLDLERQRNEMAMVGI